jgi:PBSX family phage terminase large subunit
MTMTAPPTLMMTQDPRTDPRNKPYQPIGSHLNIFYDKSDQVMAVGPSGTGKSRAMLEKMHLLMCKYAGARALMVRKTRASLTQSAMVTYEKFVVPDNGSVIWRTSEQEYRYANGSIVVIGGMDKAIKVMSSEYDFIYVQEATELTEDDWETLTIRARFGRIPYNQVVGDCNPSYPSHWIKRKIDKKEMVGVASTLQDNPVYWDAVLQDYTDKGRSYVAKLDKLTGVRLARYRKGLWAAAEGMIYTSWNPEIHMVDRFPIPFEWRRVWVIDFGYTNPFVWQCWAINPDGDAYRIAEIYQTALLVEDACALIKVWMTQEGEPRPEAIVCDHDAEDRATFERHMGMDTQPAVKDVEMGIHSVMSRLRSGDNGKPKMYFLRDSVLEPDPNLIEAIKPWCTEQEFDGYEWEDKNKKETPRKVDDHGMDDTRYLSVYLDSYDDTWVD